MKDAIGGYFGEEELTGKSHSFIHEGGALLNLGRNAFKYICLSIPNKVENIFIPWYTCPVIWRSLFWTGVEHLYSIDENLEIRENIRLGENDYIVANNYFGIKDAYIEHLSRKYGNHLIIDNAQSFYAPVIPDTYAFYSPRKFFGVPDGGIAYTAFNSRTVFCKEQDDSSNRLMHLRLRKEKGAEAGFASYQLNESKLDELPILLMSDYTHNVLMKIDYEVAKEKRRANYKMLHDTLGEMNVLSLPPTDLFSCPMVYPFIGHGDNKALRETLLKNRIYTATYWPNIGSSVSVGSFEKFLLNNLIPIPIDQRYGAEDMQRILNLIKG